jgi:3-keto-L-gulonate-6-phosphate decarboxylase
MKLQISFDHPDLDKALKIAKEISEYADILEIGTLMLNVHGLKAVEEFRTAFPEKTLLVDAKIIDRAKETVTILAKAGADWITVLAGTSNNVIHSASSTARSLGKKIMLDLIDAKSFGQSALEAQSLDVEALLLHKPYDEDSALVFLDQWDMIRGNTKLPIYISGRVTKDIYDKLLGIDPDGIIVGRAITEAENPAEEAKFFANRERELESQGGIPNPERNPQSFDAD